MAAWMDFNIYFSSSAGELKSFLEELEGRADAFIERNPRFGYDLGDASIYPGPLDVDEIFELSGDQLEEDALDRLRRSSCVLEWRGQPQWDKDPMILTLIVEMLQTGMVTLVDWDDEYDTPESLLEFFERKKFKTLKLPPAQPGSK
jgi:hypothetical protein